MELTLYLLLFLAICMGGIGYVSKRPRLIDKIESFFN